MSEPPKRKVHGVVQKLIDTMGSHSSTLDEEMEAIEHCGQSGTTERMRLALIGGLELRPRDWPKTAENLVHIGCACWGTAKAIIAYCTLLQRLDERYVFLRKEYCCGAGLVISATTQGDCDDQERAEAACTDFIGRNINQAGALGANRMLYVCPWCVYLARRFHPDAALPQLYHLDHVVALMAQRKPPMRLNARIAYFQGGQHRRTFYVPGIKWDFDWVSYRRLLDSIEGLEVVDVPKYCCVTHPEKINELLVNERIETLVTPCITCYGRMMRKAPPGVRAMTIPELLLEALSKVQPVQ